MCSTSDLFVRIAVQSAGPQERFSLLGLHSDIERGEGRFPPFFHVREVQKEGEDSRTTRQLSILVAVVVMNAVPLSYLVLEDLKGLVIFLFEIAKVRYTYIALLSCMRTDEKVLTDGTRVTASMLRSISFTKGCVWHSPRHQLKRNVSKSIRKVCTDKMCSPVRACA